jgi:hypothetical protein
MPCLVLPCLVFVLVFVLVFDLVFVLALSLSLSLSLSYPIFGLIFSSHVILPCLVLSYRCICRRLCLCFVSHGQTVYPTPGPNNSPHTLDQLVQELFDKSTLQEQLNQHRASLEVVQHEPEPPKPKRQP